MCDYSLHNVASRPARVGDRLVTTGFKYTGTRGFAAVGEPDVAVCLLPGTELAFEEQVKRERSFVFMRKNVGDKAARFRQVRLGNPNTHHDALEFSNGKVVLLTLLYANQRATVLQLPATAPGVHPASERERNLAPV